MPAEELLDGDNHMHGTVSHFLVADVLKTLDLVVEESIAYPPEDYTSPRFEKVLVHYARGQFSMHRK